MLVIDLVSAESLKFLLNVDFETSILENLSFLKVLIKQVFLKF